MDAASSSPPMTVSSSPTSNSSVHVMQFATNALEEHLPPAFLKFLSDNNVDIRNYQVTDLPRFIRVNPRNRVSKEELEKQLGCDLSPIPWLPDFYSLPTTVKIASSQAYKDGQIYGIDASSGAAVLCLDPRPGEHLLDLCCAPGAKLCMIADMVNGAGSVTGVDISEHRLAACKTIIKKYDVPSCKVHKGDGTTFDKVPSDFGRSHYDRVLVDAECTHDGSLKHLWKYHQWGWDTFERRVLDPGRIDSITDLQKRLLANGFKLLRPGGVLVYSTCSFSRGQNEDVVQWLLDNHANASLISPFPSHLSSSSSSTSSTSSSSNSSATSDVTSSEFPLPCKEGFLPLCIRFDPVTSGTGGLFIARITKTEAPAASDASTSSSIPSSSDSSSSTSVIPASSSLSSSHSEDIGSSSSSSTSSAS